MPEHPHSPRRIEVAQRRAKALEMRRAGYRLDDIAHHLGYADRAAVSKDLKRIFERIVDEPAREVLGLELSRLDGMTKVAWKAMTNGDLSAIDRLAKIMHRRARLLGLDYTDRGAADHSDVEAWLSGMTDEVEEGHDDDDGAPEG